MKALREDNTNKTVVKLRQLEDFLNQHDIDICVGGNILQIRIGKKWFHVQGDNLPRLVEEDRLILVSE